jgi:hypothetical protein
MDHHGESLAHAHEARGDRGAQEAAETLVADEKKMQQSQEDAGAAAAACYWFWKHRPPARALLWLACLLIAECCWRYSERESIQQRFSYVVAELITLLHYVVLAIAAEIGVRRLADYYGL